MNLPTATLCWANDVEDEDCKEVRPSGAPASRRRALINSEDVLVVGVTADANEDDAAGAVVAVPSTVVAARP